MRPQVCRGRRGVSQVPVCPPGGVCPRSVLRRVFRRARARGLCLLRRFLRRRVLRGRFPAPHGDGRVCRCFRAGRMRPSGYFVLFRSWSTASRIKSYAFRRFRLPPGVEFLDFYHGISSVTGFCDRKRKPRACRTPCGKIPGSPCPPVCKIKMSAPKRGTPCRKDFACLRKRRTADRGVAVCPISRENGGKCIPDR